MTTNAEIGRLAARIRVAARDGGLIETAQVKLLGLEQVREVAGARWPRMREYVREGSLRIIATRIGPKDAVIPCGDGFLVAFSDSSPAEMERRCRAINDALLSFYLGEEALKALRTAISRAPVSTAQLANIVSYPPGAHAGSPRRADLNPGRFWPIWSPARNGLAAYLCTPTLESEGGACRIGYTSDFLEKARCDATDFLDLDLCLLEQAVSAAEIAQGLVVGVSVHASTLQIRKSRMQYLRHLTAYASPAAGPMFVHIAEIAPGTPLLSLTEWTSSLRHAVPRISFELHRSDRALSAIASTGAWAAGYHLGALTGATSEQIRSALSELDNCCRVLRRQCVQPFIHGFSETAFFDLASFSEIAFATGEALWPSQSALSSARAASSPEPAAASTL